MSLLQDIINHRVPRKQIPIGRVNGCREVRLDDSVSNYDDDDEAKPSGTDYAKNYIKEEMKLYAECYKNDTLKGGGMAEIDDVMSVVSTLELEDLNKMAHYPEIYSNYNFETTTVKKELPIDSFRDKVLNMVNTNSVVVIHGPTGCGKTTQVPQYILDDCRTHNKYCNIVVTQPRKIATITVCRRVCEERGWTLGTICGYQIGLEKQVSHDTILSFVTTGVLLQRLIASKNLHQYTHIVIDEVHERNQELDFLLLVVRKFLFTHSPHTKVILMSATIDAEELAHYFRTQSGTKAIAAPIIHIDKENQFTKHIYYADHLNTLQPLPRFDLSRPEISPESYKLLKLLIGAFDNLDEKDPKTGALVIGSVLVFLPGINEIEEAQKILVSDIRPEKKVKWTIVPLHSSLPNDEQAKAFYKPRPGERKIILSTNIAESSITVTDIFYVIDFCLTKVMVQDPDTKFMSLVLEWASHVNCEQRAGRAGRVANGRVYRLVDTDFYQNEMQEKSLPEILRAPLDRVVLQSKRLNLAEPPKAILALALNPPDLSNIEATIWGLKECGGLLTTCSLKPSVSDGDLTFLGTVMASLPIEVRLSKLIVLGHMFNCLKECIIIAAGCSIQNIFKTPFQRRFEAFKTQLMWSDESCSDLISLMNLYNVWQTYRRQNTFAHARSEKHWCNSHYVSLRGLQEWNSLVVELTQRLKALRIEETVGPQKPLLDRERPIFLKVIMCGAFYPNYFTRSSRHGQINEREAVRTIGGRDPFRTIYLTGLSSQQPGPLYIKQIKKLIQSGSDIETKVTIGFDGSSKIYIEFPNYKMPESVNVDGQQMIAQIGGRIALPVFEAVRKRQLKIPFDIKVLPDRDAWEYADNLKKIQEQKMIEKRMYSEDYDYEVANVIGSVLPSLDTQYIKITITWKIDPAYFWAQNCREDTSYVLSVIEDSLNRYPLTALGDTEQVVVGAMYAVKFHEDGRFYRGKVTIIDPTKKIYILFVDYGNMQLIEARNIGKDLFKLPEIQECQVPPLAMECVLSNIQPRVDLASKTLWNKKVNELFDKETSGLTLYGKVYSVVDDVVHIELFKSMPGSGTGMKSLNQFLIERGYAVQVEESYLSQEDHKKREAVLTSENPSKEMSIYNSTNKEEFQDLECPDFDSMRHVKTIKLKGPFSPLEMKVYGILRSSGDKNCDIEGGSVNTVLLDDDPQNPDTRLLVAAYVGQTMGGSLRLRQTTLMPKITGFPMLMSLIFCPSMEPKITEDGTRVASILCGLGFNEDNGKAWYPVHDLILQLDTELRIEVIEAVNKLRYYMNSSIEIMEETYNQQGSPNDIIMLQSNIKKHLWTILNMNLKAMAPIDIKYHDVWNHFLHHPEKLEVPEKKGNEIWPMLWFLKLNALTNDDAIKKQNIEELHNMAQRMIPHEPIRCQLCMKDLLSLSEVRFHLIGQDHKHLESEFKKKFDPIEY